jgi:hypothetical protein
MPIAKSLLIISALIYCNDSLAQLSSSMTANWNEHIESKSRNEINLLDHQIISSFYENNPAKLIALYSERLGKKAADKTQGLVNFIHSVIKTNKYSILDEYLTFNTTIGSKSVVFKGVSEDNDYKVNYDVYSKETYISLMVYSGGNRQWLITAIYGKYAGNWKMDVILISQYKVLNKNAVDLYKQAKIDYQRGDLIGAANNMLLSKEVQDPAGDVFIYFKEPEIESFRYKIDADLKKIKFPIIVSDVPTLPEIFKVEPVVINEGIFPMVKYQSKINLEDTVALKKENDQVQTVIGKIFPGIEKNKKYVFFKAYNQTPDGDVPVKNYGFMLKNGEK